MYLYLNDTVYDDQYKDIVRLYQDHLNEIAVLQDPNNGQWHQVINDTSTFLEASCSTGFLRSMLDGRLKGLLPKNVFTEKDWDDKIDLAWNGLNMFVNMSTGEIYDACCGTGIQNDVEGYETRSTDYCRIGNPGDAAFIINLLVAYQKYINLEHL